MMPATPTEPAPERTPPDDTSPLRGCHLDAIRRRVDAARDSDCSTTAEEDRAVLLAEVDRLASLTDRPAALRGAILEAFRASKEVERSILSPVRDLEHASAMGRLVVLGQLVERFALDAPETPDRDRVYEIPDEDVTLAPETPGDAETEKTDG
jgi:hypothetical protein